MKYVIPFLFSATPALAHHELVTTASLLPVAMGLVTIAATAIAAWRDWRTSKKE